MQIINSVRDMQNYVVAKRAENKTIGFVPTMGYLHQGHLKLMLEARKTDDIVVASIFVNPLQFGLGEDYEKYPRDISRDASLAQSVGVDVLFVPETAEMYPNGYNTFVNVEKITEGLCGAARPGHFKGVTTVVAKLFNIIQPTNAYFGQKDAQQVTVIQQMVVDLNMPLKIVIVPIVREEDGLALSSRNVYLGHEERQQALVLSRALKKAKEMIDSGERGADKILLAMQNIISEASLAAINYIEIVDAEHLEKLETLSGKVLIAIAVKFPSARLIDNIIVEVA